MRQTNVLLFPALIIRKFQVHVWDHAMELARMRNIEIANLRVFDNEDGTYWLFNMLEEEDEVIWKAFSGKYSYRNIVSHSLLAHFEDVNYPDKSPFDENDEFMSPPDPPPPDDKVK
jgi:hypothetical protein